MAFALLLSALSGLGCGGPAVSAPGLALQTIAAKNHDAHARSVLVLMPATTQSEAVWEGLRGELGASFNLVVARVGKDTSVSAVEKAIEGASPACVVLINNSTVRLYHEYQEAAPRGTRFPPAVIVMTSFLEQTYGAIENATGISYEVPGVIQFVKLRRIVDRPLRRVGVVYRRQFAEFIEKERRLSRPEEIEIVGAEIGRDPSDAELSTALHDLLTRPALDAVWVLNDNALLTPQRISSVWLPVLEREQRLPVIVGTPALLKNDYPVGTFAMVPDHVALGVQAANLIFNLAEQKWTLSGRGIDLPISMKTVVNLGRARKQFGLRTGAVDNIDQVVE